LVDLDNDGRTDILSGSWPGAISLFRRKADGTFAAPLTLKDRRGQPLDVGSASAAFSADWDGDGTLDLIVGTMTGDVHFIPNDGRPGVPAFGPPRLMEANGSPIKVAGDAAPVVADWDGDGTLDLVVGAEDGSVVWYRNAGRPRAPRLEAARPLIGPSPIGWGGDERRRPGDWGLRVKPCVVDWDGDGQLDILLGDRCGGFRAKPAQSDIEREEEQRANDHLPELRSKWAAAFRTFRELAEPPIGETTAAGQERLRLREASRREMMRYKEEIAKVQSIQERYQPGYQSHGFVWIFLRLPRSSTRGW
jgi:hypothetical protein